MTLLFDARVRARFPIGMPVSNLIPQLDDEGFKRTWFDIDDEHSAARAEGDWVCNIPATVHWKSDTRGRLASVRGTFREAGCL